MRLPEVNLVISGFCLGLVVACLLRADFLGATVSAVFALLNLVCGLSGSRT